jgi:hypothetical protein
MRALFFSLTLLGALSASDGFGQDTWKVITARDGSFTVEMPFEPEYSTTMVKTAGGREYARHNYIGGNSELAFVVQTATYPRDVDVSKPKSNLQGGLDLAAKQMEGGKWSEIRWTTYQGHQATDSIAMKPPYQVRNFSVLKGRTIFTLTYAGPPETVQSADVNRFMNSFFAKK